MRDDILKDLPQRLESMVTRWSLVRVAHDASTVPASKARNELVLRYSDATKNYIRGIVRDEASAEEIAQNAVLRMLSGDFAGADPNRGRFRDLLKVAARNMVRNHWAKEKRRRAAALDVESLEETNEPDDAEAWVSNWRQNTLDLTWKALEKFERSRPGSHAYTLLKLRAGFPDASSEELAERLSEAVDEKVTSEAARQKLRRARVKFAELLVDEVADGLQNPSADEVEEELAALGLIEYIRKLLPSEWKELRGQNPPE
jgi:DNA-directed RNA polymerase specialized sigma24 family protein